MIPSQLKLNGNQQYLAREFIKNHPPSKDEHADTCGTSRFTFTVVASGIGDIVHISCGEDSLYLDDGEES